MRIISDRAHLTSSCSGCSPNPCVTFLVTFCAAYSFLQIDLIAIMLGYIFHSHTC